MHRDSPATLSPSVYYALTSAKFYPTAVEGGEGMASAWFAKDDSPSSYSRGPPPASTPKPRCPHIHCSLPPTHTRQHTATKQKCLLHTCHTVQDCHESPAKHSCYVTRPAQRTLRGGTADVRCERKLLQVPASFLTDCCVSPGQALTRVSCHPHSPRV